MARVIALQHARYQDGRTGIIFERAKVKRVVDVSGAPTEVPVWLGVAEDVPDEVVEKFYRGNPAFEVIDDTVKVEPPSDTDRPRRKKKGDDEPKAE